LPVFNALIQLVNHINHNELTSILTNTEIGNITKNVELVFRPAKGTPLTKSELTARGISLTGNNKYYDTDFDNDKLKKHEIKSFDS
jgi:hypothetical protein